MKDHTTTQTARRQKHYGRQITYWSRFLHRTRRRRLSLSLALGLGEGV